MLPVIRSDEHLYPVPKFDIEKGDIKDFMNELSGFHEQFADCFQRSESREHFFKYIVGQFGDIELKSIETIALAAKDGNVRALQRFVSDAPWDDENMLTKYRSFVNDDLGSPDGALIFDESSFINKGQDSVGGARQVLRQRRKGRKLPGRCVCRLCIRVWIRPARQALVHP